MDHARKLRIEAEEDIAARLRPKADTSSGHDGYDKVLRFSPAVREPETASPRERTALLTGRDIKAAIDLVQEAAKSIKAAEDRARDGEARAQSLLTRATEELKGAEARVQAAEARAREAEGRAQDAEARLREAEAWLRQIFSVISDELPQQRR